MSSAWYNRNYMNVGITYIEEETKMGVFVNFSNHPSEGWNDEQIVAARQYGEIVDVEFPKLNACMSENEIGMIGEDYVTKILKLSPDVVMCQGEFTLTFYVVKKLMNKGITCVSACSERTSIEVMQEDGSVRKESLFLFSGFRRYI